MEKILDIIDSIANEKGLPPSDVTQALKTALVNMAKRSINEDIEYEVEIDKQSKNAKIFQIIKVLNDDDKRLLDDNGLYMALSEAKEEDEDIEVEDEIRIEYSLENLGRTAVANLYEEIEFHIQRLIEENLYSKYKDMVGSVVSGLVVYIDNKQNTYIEINELRAMLPMKNRIKGESFKVGDTLKGVLKRVNIDQKNGIFIEISRTTPKFLEALLASEVPEIQDGLVQIKNSARIPGERAKVALYTEYSHIDAIGSTVGVKGVRINSVSRELKNENIDCIEYSPIPEIYVSRAMAPAIVTNVKIDNKKAIIHLPSEQKAKAIGKSGINIRLASMLTGYQLELIEEKSSVMSQEIAMEEEPKKQSLNDALSALFKD